MMLKTTKELRTGLRNEGSGTYLEGLMVEQVITSYLEQGFHQLLQAKSAPQAFLFLNIMRKHKSMHHDVTPSR